MAPGDEVHFELHTTDATTAVVITIYKAGTETARTLATDEFLSVDSLLVVAAIAGDHQVYFGTDGTPAAGSRVARGAFSANGGALPQYFTTQRVGVKGDDLRLVTDTAGIIDVTGTGRIFK